MPSVSKWRFLVYNDCSQLTFYFDKLICLSPHPFVRSSGVVPSSVRHKKLTSPNQQRFLKSVVAYASVMRNITLGSHPEPQGPIDHPEGIPMVKPKVGQMKKVINQSCQECFSAEKNQHHHPAG